MPEHLTEYIGGAMDGHRSWNAPHFSQTNVGMNDDGSTVFSTYVMFRTRMMFVGYLPAMTQERARDLLVASLGRER